MNKKIDTSLLKQDIFAMIRAVIISISTLYLLWLFMPEITMTIELALRKPVVFVVASVSILKWGITKRRRIERRCHKGWTVIGNDTF